MGEQRYRQCALQEEVDGTGQGPLEPGWQEEDSTSQPCSKIRCHCTSANWRSTPTRRTNKSTESLLINVERLKAYMGNPVTFPKKGKGAAPAVAQFKGTVMPVAQAAYKVQSRAITAEEKSANVFRDMRIARADARMIGIRQK